MTNGIRAYTSISRTATAHHLQLPVLIVVCCLQQQMSSVNVFSCNQTADKLGFDLNVYVC